MLSSPWPGGSVCAWGSNPGPSSLTENWSHPSDSTNRTTTAAPGACLAALPTEDLEGTAERALANGCVPYDELPEDKNEVNYRPKRSDKFKGPENCLFDIADHPWIGTGTMKETVK